MSTNGGTTWSMLIVFIHNGRIATGRHSFTAKAQGVLVRDLSSFQKSKVANQAAPESSKPLIR